MKNILTLSLLTTVACISWVLPAWAAPVPEEAQRHFNRGMAAVEMAQDADGYASAIDEFSQATVLAPDWPDAYYNLGLIQDKAGRYSDAAASLRHYLQLAPNASDATAIRAMIDKAEFKAEQTLSDADILALFTSLTDKSLWQVKGISKTELLNQDLWWGTKIVRDGPDSLHIVYPAGHCFGPDQYRTLNGRTLDFGTLYCTCSAAADTESCMENRRFFLEVVSKSRVKVRMRYWYPKITGGGTDEASFEFIRR